MPAEWSYHPGPGAYLPKYGTLSCFFGLSSVRLWIFGVFVLAWLLGAYTPSALIPIAAYVPGPGLVVTWNTTESLVCLYWLTFFLCSPSHGEAQVLIVVILSLIPTRARKTSFMWLVIMSIRSMTHNLIKRFSTGTKRGSNLMCYFQIISGWSKILRLKSRPQRILAWRRFLYLLFLWK